MPGLIEKEIDNGSTVYKGKVDAYDPTLRSVDAGKETVSGQMNTLLTTGNPYVDRARASSTQATNARGLVNSTMGAQAGEAAAIDAVLPIASADANTYTTASRDNQGFSNTASQFEAAARNTANQNMANAANTSQLSTQQTKQQKELNQQSADIQTGQILPATTAAQKEIQAQSGEIQTALQTLKGGQAETLAGIEANYKTLIQTSASASEVYKAAMNSISAIFADTTIDAAAKANIINGQLGWLRQQMNIIGSVNGVDLTGLTDFGTVTAP